MPSRLASLGFACLCAFGARCILDIKAARSGHQKHQRTRQVYIEAHGVATGDSTLVHQFGDEVEDFAPRRKPNGTLHRGLPEHEDVRKSTLYLLKEAEEQLGNAFLDGPWKGANNPGSLKALFSVMHFHSSTHLMIHDMILFARFLLTDYSESLDEAGAVMRKEDVSTFFVRWQMAASKLLGRQFPNTAAFLDIDILYQRLAPDKYTPRPWSESRPDQRDRTNLHSKIIDTIVFEIPQDISPAELFEPMFMKAEIVKDLSLTLRWIAELLNGHPSATEEMLIALDRILGHGPEGMAGLSADLRHLHQAFEALDRILGLGPNGMKGLSADLIDLYRAFKTWRENHKLNIRIEAKDILRVKTLNHFLPAFSKAPEWIPDRPNLYSSNVPQSLNPMDTVLYEAASSWKKQKEGKANCGMTQHLGFYRGSTAGHLLDVDSGVEYGPNDEIPAESIALKPQLLSPFATDPEDVNEWLTGDQFLRAIRIPGNTYQFGFNTDGNFAAKHVMPLPSGSTGVNGILVESGESDWGRDTFVPVCLFQSDFDSTLSFVSNYVTFRDANMPTIVAMWTEAMRLYSGESEQDEIVYRVFQKLNAYVQHLYKQKGIEAVQNAFTAILGLRVRSTCQTWEMPFERQSLQSFISGVDNDQAQWLAKLLKLDPEARTLAIQEIAEQHIQNMKRTDAPYIIKEATRKLPGPDEARGA